ncbi:LiaF transmembrane domain-containing protein [Mucilaginibacter ginkgonis]|uniref:LiaF transmembrane domain-containing protein n=1 Tax=Mucilaginibacter ginkgonis TaxID=2682091 RepID=A0A6I4I7I2_9SPHI|nr:DUF5668 domain-containing protein [Mucilaginibacter ginkgonis]QQL49169.1 hypothetical protein GO620_013430 [Mucilaginibacter ginkgonis]
MKKDRLTPGLILLVIGVFLLLKNFGFLPAIRWSNIIHLWPIFLVIGGINLIFANNRSVWASVLKITVTVAGIALILLGHFGDNYSFFPEFHVGRDYNLDDDDDNDSDTTNAKGLVQVSGSSFYHVPFAADAKSARLEISGGGNRFQLSDTTSQLFTANVNGNANRYEMETRKEDSSTVVNFRMKNSHHQNFHWGDDNDKANTTIFKLNSAPLWDVNLKAGATDLNFDLTKFKIRNFRLSGGAASFAVKFGTPVESDTNVNVSSGVSDIKISVPNGAACSITSSTGLSDNKFNGFTKTSDNHYETPGFANAKKRIYINISGGMSDFSVDRY